MQHQHYDGAIPIAWRMGTQGGPFTMDAGGGGGSNDGQTSVNANGYHFDARASSSASTTPAASPMPYSTASYGIPLPSPSPSSSYPTQVPPQWATAALASGSPLASLPSPLIHHQQAQHHAIPYGYLGGYPASLPNFAYGSVAPAAPPIDPNLFALHLSLEQQAQTRLGQSPVGSPAAMYAASQLPASSTPMGPPATTSSAGPSRRSSKHGGRSNGVGAPGTSVPPRQRQNTGPNTFSATTTPLGSPQTQSFFPPTHTRPLPPMPRRMNGTGTAPSSAHVSPLASPQTATSLNSVHFPTASTSAATPAFSVHSRNVSNINTAASQQASPRASLPPVDFDFSSLESDLDRFNAASSNSGGASGSNVGVGGGGGFASAAAAAMANVGSQRRGQKAVAGAYGVGGYGSPSPLSTAGPTLENGPAGAKSPRVLADVLSESVAFPPRSPGPSNAPSPIDFSAFIAGSPADSTGGASRPSPLSGGSAGGGGGAGSGGEATDSPVSSNMFDEDGPGGGDLFLSGNSKDPIAAQVWRMFNKAKNTLPNGARMENLTWRLMSMTLKKRREEGAASAAAAAAAAATGEVNQESRARAAPDDEAERARIAQEEADAEAAEVAAEAENDLQELRSRSDSLVRAAGSRLPSGVGAVAEEEDRGRRRRTGAGTSSGSSGTKSASASASPEAVADEDDFMDWRAKSQSRSRSHAPDTMDWRAQSRSRSRAPDFRVSVAPPTVDIATATANFSRYYGDGSASAAPIVSSPAPAPTAPLALDTSAADSRNAELAASLNLSPTGSFGLHFETAAMPSFASPASPVHSSFGTIKSPPISTDPTSLLSQPSVSSASSFSFPSDSTSPDGTATDPNLTAIENTLNQLINLQSLSSSGGDKSSGSSSSSAAARRAAHRVNGQESAYASLAQQQLSQLASTSPPTGSSSNAYHNAASLAQSARPFSFAGVHEQNSSAPPQMISGLALARPSGIVPDLSSSIPPSPAAFFNSQPPSPFAYPSSAPGPGSAFIGSPPINHYVGSHDTSQYLYDYFAHNPGTSSGYTSPYLANGGFDSTTPTHIDPAQLYRNLQQSIQQNPPHDGAVEAESEDSKPGATSQNAASGSVRKQKLGAAGVKNRSASTNDLVGLGSAAKGKTASAPTSRTHSRSNTISMPATVVEGQPLQLSPHEAPSGLSTATGSKPAAPSPTKAPPPAGGITRCLNCSTTNTPLWRRDADGRPLCNACGLFRNLHGVDRPANLNTGVIKKRNRIRPPKDQPPKKTGPGARAAARRDSTGGPSPAPASAAAARGAARPGAPYPSTASRSTNASATTSPSA